MITPLKHYCDSLISAFDQVPAGRKLLLEKMALYIAGKIKDRQPVKLVYICTHNSRRSHFGQVWAKVAAFYYAAGPVYTFSGGTETTAVNSHAIEALQRAGFKVKQKSEGHNPVYEVFFDEEQEPVTCFSKTWDHAANPVSGFAAVMTCSDAEENCPFIAGAGLRIGTTYEDPKVFDGTGQQDEKYDERCRQIAVESFYVFSRVKVLSR